MFVFPKIEQTRAPRNSENELGTEKDSNNIQELISVLLLDWDCKRQQLHLPARLGASALLPRPHSAFPPHLDHA